MKQEIKDRWISLLESGEYKFGKHYLYKKDTDCHCALGVLVEMAIEAGVYEPVVTQMPSGKHLSNINSRTLTSGIQQWAGISHNDLDSLSRINDNPVTLGYEPVINYIKENL